MEGDFPSRYLYLRRAGLPVLWGWCWVIEEWSVGFPWGALNPVNPVNPDKTGANFVNFQQNWGGLLNGNGNHDDDDDDDDDDGDDDDNDDDLLKKSNLSSHSVLLWSIQGDSMWEKEGEHSVFALSM